MASDASAFAATEVSPATRPAAAATPPPAIIPSDEAVRLLKRPRSPSPSSPRSLTSPSQPLNALGSPTKSARLALATRGSPPPPFTGAAALEDERRRREEEAEQEQAQNPPLTSENPTQKALASLMSGAVQNLSRPADAPQTAPTAAMETSPRVPNPVSLAQSATGQLMERGETSPQSTTSVVGVPVTESPTPMEVDNKGEHAQSSQQVAVQEERPQPGSLSYPGSLQSTANLAETPIRGMTFPSPTLSQTSPMSAGSKKHKCPYCNTEFTRHHNLKSHLLTHSQEKPYVCTDCQMRFRRLHDLKRHGKLHTGEKPHICPKCDRKFARGDALARHSKGAGGCAGRRSSMGSFADGDELDGTMGDPDDSAMSGLAYDNEEDELRRQSLPSINAQHVPVAQGDAYATHSRSYPPNGPRSAASGLYPPNVAQNQVGSNASPTVANNLASSHASIALASGNANVYPQASITESPKPLSPGQETTSIGRQRSPSLTQQLQQQQQQFGRRPSDLQSPHSGQPRPKLPGLSHPGFAAPNSAGYSHTRTGSGTQAGSDSGNMFAQSDPSVWAYVQSLEEKIKQLSDKVNTLDHEVVTLKQQLDGREVVTKAQ